MKLSPSFFGATRPTGVPSNFATKRAAIGKLRPDKLAVLAVNIGVGGLNYFFAFDNFHIVFLTELLYNKNTHL